jgi:hypothetical protein
MEGKCRFTIESMHVVRRHLCIDRNKDVQRKPMTKTTGCLAGRADELRPWARLRSELRSRLMTYQRVNAGLCHHCALRWKDAVMSSVVRRSGD